MPVYKVPLEKPYGDSVSETGKKPKPHRKKLWGIPLSKAMLAELEVGQEVVATLRGKVVGISLSEDKERSHQDFEMEVEEVELPEEYGKMAEA